MHLSTFPNISLMLSTNNLSLHNKVISVFHYPIEMNMNMQHYQLIRRFLSLEVNSSNLLHEVHLIIRRNVDDKIDERRFNCQGLVSLKLHLRNLDDWL